MRFLVASTGGAGHILPMVPLVRELQAAGHEVLWAMAPDSASTVEQFGIAVRTAGISRAEVIERVFARWPDFVDLMMGTDPRDRRRVIVPRFFAGIQGPAMHDDLSGLVDEWRPDAIVHEPMELASAPLAESRGLPRIVIGYGAFEPDDPLSYAGDELRRVVEPGRTRTTSGCRRVRRPLPASVPARVRTTALHGFDPPDETAGHRRDGARR